jgi:hypothetical protein
MAGDASILDWASGVNASEIEFQLFYLGFRNRNQGRKQHSRHGRFSLTFQLVRRPGRARPEISYTIHSQ